MKRLSLFILALLVSASLAFGQATTFQRMRLSAGSTATLAEVTSAGELLVSSLGTASAAPIDATTFPRVRIAGGTTGNLAEVDSTGHLLVSVGSDGVWTLATSLTTPLLIGGIATTSSLTYKTTTGVGTTGADHIWQVGSNGATEAMRILNSGLVGIGSPTPLTTLQVSTTVTGAVRGIMTAQYSTGTAGAQLLYRKARGTEANPTITVTGDNLSSLNVEGYDGAAYLQMGFIGYYATGTIGTNRIPTKVDFYTATDAATSVLTKALTIDEAQVVRPQKSMIIVPPATQTIGAGGTIASDACGGLKRVTAAGAVSTDTTNVFTAPSAANTGCEFMLCNVGATNSITLKHATLFFSLAGADVVLLANTCVGIVQDGTQYRQSTAILTAS